MYHYRKTRKRYKARMISACAFCDPATLAKKIADFDHSYIVANLTSYDHWELHDVTEHLLLVPKRHVESLGDLDDSEKLEIMQVCSDYEKQGYNVYARGFQSSNKSIPHQHTHLIKITGKQAKAALFVKKPYFLVKVT